MILYFTGTGNSHYTAQIIGKITGDRVVSINKLLKTGSNKMLESKEPFVIVCPTYAWRMPRIVEGFIKNTHFSGSSEMYFVFTCGDDTGNAVHYAKELCIKNGFIFKGFASVIMPENYIVMFQTPDRAKADEILKKAVPHILQIAEYIKNGQPLPEKKAGLASDFKSSIVNSLFYPICVSARGFYSSDSCTGCGKCAELCPLNNIKIINSRPHWSDNCTQCMACICGCPEEAIEYKNKSKGKPRYYNVK